MWPAGSGQIQTSVQAGGMARELMRWRLSRSRMRTPLGAKYIQPAPARRRVMPGNASVTYVRPARTARRWCSRVFGDVTCRRSLLRLSPQDNRERRLALALGRPGVLLEGRVLVAVLDQALQVRDEEGADSAHGFVLGDVAELVAQQPRVLLETAANHDRVAEGEARGPRLRE